MIGSLTYRLDGRHGARRAFRGLLARHGYHVREEGGVLTATISSPSRLPELLALAGKYGLTVYGEPFRPSQTPVRPWRAVEPQPLPAEGVTVPHSGTVQPHTGGGVAPAHPRGWVDVTRYPLPVIQQVVMVKETRLNGTIITRTTTYAGARAYNEARIQDKADKAAQALARQGVAYKAGRAMAQPTPLARVTARILLEAPQFDAVQSTQNHSRGLFSLARNGR